jgi:hypothetical protein
MVELSLIIEPDAEEPQAAEVYIDGAVGDKPYRFLLDSGAAKSALIFDAYTGAFQAQGQHGSSGVFARHSEDLITVPTIKVGSISRTNFTLVRMAKERGADAKSLIGMDFLQDLRCHFFFNESRVSVDEDAGAAVGDMHELITDSKYHPHVDVHFGAARANAVWDTGASMTIVDLETIKQYPSFFEPVGQSTGTDSTGHSMETPTFILSNVQIGDHVFPPHAVAGVDLSHVNSTVEIPMHLILGYSTLSHANWLFDFPRKQWAISKALWI